MCLCLVCVCAEPDTPEPSWASVVDNFAPLSAKQLSRVNAPKILGQPFARGWTYHSLACEGGPYLIWLHKYVVVTHTYTHTHSALPSAPQPTGHMATKPGALYWQGQVHVSVYVPSLQADRGSWRHRASHTRLPGISL